MGNAPAIGLRVTLDGVETVEARLKSAKAEVRQIKKDLQDAIKTGGDAEKQFKRLNEAYANVERIKASGRGTSPSGMARGGGMQFNTVKSTSGGSNLGREFKSTVNDVRDAGGILNGLSRGGIEGTTEALRNASGLLRGKGALGNLAIPLALGASAVQEYGEGMKDIQRSSEAKYSAFQTLRGLEETGGERATIKSAEAARAKYRREAVNKLGAFDNFVQESSFFNTSVAGFSLKGVTDYFGLTSRQGELDAKAAENLDKEIGKASAHLKNAQKAAGMGDLARAQAEQQAALRETSPAGNAIVYQQITAQGTPAEQYLRAENVRRFNAEYTQLHDKRGSLRTGD